MRIGSVMYFPPAAATVTRPPGTATAVPNAVLGRVQAFSRGEPANNLGDSWMRCSPPSTDNRYPGPHSRLRQMARAPSVGG